jgi:hypothetical protein
MSQNSGHTRGKEGDGRNSNSPSEVSVGPPNQTRNKRPSSSGAANSPINSASSDTGMSVSSSISKKAKGTALTTMRKNTSTNKTSFASMESLFCVPSILLQGAIQTKYPTQEERDVLLQRLEREVLLRFKIGKHRDLSDSREKKRRIKGKENNNKKTIRATRTQDIKKEADRKTRRVGSSDENENKKTEQQRKNVDFEQVMKGGEKEVNVNVNKQRKILTAQEARSRLCFGVNQCTRAMEHYSATMMMASRKSEAKKTDKKIDNDNDSKESKIIINGATPATKTEPNALASLCPATTPTSTRPQLLILSRDVRPPHMLAHLVGMAHSLGPTKPIPVLLLPGRASYGLGQLLGIRTCSALLFTERRSTSLSEEQTQAANDLENDKNNAKACNICHKDIDYFIEYAKSKIPL